MRKLMFLLVVLFATMVIMGCVSYQPKYISNESFSKVGEAGQKDGGVIKAAQNGGISKVALVDLKQKVFGMELYGIPLYLFNEVTFVVAGE